MVLDLGLQRHTKDLRLKSDAGKRYVFDPVRKRWIVLQPEEFVRQLLVQHMLQDCHYPSGHIVVEKGLQVNYLKKRCDVLVYDRQGAPWLLVECKAPQVRVDQHVFRQIAIYNMPLRVPWLLVTNGQHTYCCKLNWIQKNWTFEKTLPPFPLNSAKSKAGEPTQNE